MKVLKKILEKSKYTYEVIHHEKNIHSAQDGSEYFGIEVGQTAPTLILKTDKGFFALVISGNVGKVDFDKIAYILNCTKVKMASQKEVKKVTGFEVGNVPMVGLPIPYAIDKQLFKYDFIYGGSGQSTFTLKIEPQALNELNHVIVTF